MSNPEYNQTSIKKRKRPGVALDSFDSSELSEVIGVHNSSAPSLSDGDVKQLQLDDQANLKVSFGDNTQLIEIKAANVFPIPMGWKRKIDYDVRTDGQPVYIGFNEMAAVDGDDDWYIFKFTYTSDFNTLTESATGSWTGRAALFA